MNHDEREKLKSYARELYLELDTEGQRVFSFAEISAKLRDKFGNTVSDDTIRNWSQFDKWETLLQIAKNVGIEKALKEKETREEAIKEKKADEIAEIYKANMVFVRATAKKIAVLLQDNNVLLENRELFWLYKCATDNVIKLHELTKITDDEKIQELFNRLDEMILNEPTNEKAEGSI
jgi:hypothetical protein